MDELKNLVIQSLETNGVLGQVRAQLRSCVFKVIDNQDQVEQKRSSFHWENPKAKALRESKSGSLMAELIKEFLKFYRLDYTLAIYEPETNLKGEIDREDLAERAGLSNGFDESQPILLQLLESFNQGEKGNKSFASSGMKEMKKVEPLSLNSVPPEPKFALDQQKTEANLAKGQDLLAELERENKSGFQLDNDNKFGDKKASGLASLGKNLDKKSSSDDAIGDNYDDDFDDDIPEDLPDQHDDIQIEDEAAARNQPA